ncbi:MAG: ABC transporter ATP-binding protein/permease [Bacilli bacterium]|nr:ABC transporter ATP-binding protein/permease [Bacilli bacterium]
MFTNKYLRKYYLHYSWLLIIGVIILGGIDYLQTILPEFLGQITDTFKKAIEINAFNDEMQSDVLRIATYTILISIGMMLGRMLWRFAIFRASKGIEAKLRHEMFEKAERLPVEYYHTNSVGTVMSWFTNDVETIEEFIGWGTVMMVDALFLSTLVVIKMVRYNLAMTLLIAIPLVLIIVWGALVEKFMSNVWDNRQKSNDDLYDYSRESITGLRVIKAFVKEKQELYSFSKVAKKNQEANIKFVRIYMIFDITIEIILAGLTVLIIWLGGYFVYLTANGGTPNLFGITFSFELKDLVTMLAYMDLIIWPMIALGQIISSYSRSKTSMKRISRFLDTPEIIKDAADAIDVENPKGEIIFKDFSFIYPSGKKEELQDINLTIKAGETIGVVGKIGSGKTTLVNALLRIYNVNENQVFIDGVDIMKIKLNSLHNIISYVPQDNYLFSDTLRRNIAFGDVNTSLDKVEEAAKFACVDEDIEEFSLKYETISGERGVTLSGGQKQRISIARAYIRQTPILILDDSVSAVDIKTEETILANIKNDRKGKTTILVSSRVSTVKDLDRIIVMNEGKVEAFDTPKNLFSISPTYKRMVLLQQLEEEKVTRKEEIVHER